MRNESALYDYQIWKYMALAFTVDRNFDILIPDQITRHYAGDVDCNFPIYLLIL